MIRSIFALVSTLALVTPFAYAAPTSSPSPRPALSRPPAPVRSGSAAPSPSSSASAAPAAFDLGVWTVHASSIDANFKSGDFSTPAKIVMTRTGGDVTADRANGNYKKKLLFLNGHVVMHDTQGTARSFAGGGAQENAPSPSTLTADKAQIDGQAKVYKAIGNVHYVQADTVVDADNGTLDDQAHTLLLEGAVHITEGTRSMTARKVLYNTLTGNAHAEGNVTMQFPGELHRKLATPRPINVPKNKFTQPVGEPSAQP
jgi:lipopolysaccharide assembly outer membrane protein LptD (OstA)